MKASLEPVQWVLRIHRDGGYGSDYIGAATVTVDDLKVATLRALVTTQPFTSAMWEAMDAAFAEIGVKEILWTRRTHGKVRPMRLQIKGRKGA